MKILPALLSFSLLTSVAALAQDAGPIVPETPEAVPEAVAPEKEEPAPLDLESAEGIVTNSLQMILVRLPAGYWAGKHEVTQEQFQKVMDRNPSQFKGPNRPVDSVSWIDAMAFCRKLTELERAEEVLPEGFRYALPTEAQWEYFVNEAQLADAVTSEGRGRQATADVGSLGPNKFGLHDTRGNVWEFCREDSQAYRVLRGAAWNTDYEVNLRKEFRWYAPGPDAAENSFGFRVVLTPGQ
jgi:formylglycine-generating enzyme required for sulfatase activity